MNSNKIYIIAEMACSHDGSMDKARAIIDGAGKAGADIIQLQIWALRHVLTPEHEVYEVCRKIELTQRQWRDMAAYSRQRYPKMEIYVCVFEHQSVDFIETLGVDGYKLNSADLSNPYVLDRVAATGKKINLSVGASTTQEIRAALERVGKRSKAPVTLMYGFQNFPTELGDINLDYMATLKGSFGLPVGYQDHCDAETGPAFWVPAMSVGMGTSVLEKHITHDRSLKGIDHQSALNPDEFGDFVRMVRELELARGSGEARPFSGAELKYRKFQKKSVVAVRPLKAGERLKEQDLDFLRGAQLGLPPDQAGKVIGRTLKRDIPVHHNIREEDCS
ncbi:MAG: N-acetylneuraminate synthase family protein [Candidatus Omnitrophica bacterium]|nr:N-acetylneuraminate synthase family protein [Candidatus Omnitrophota bacterium]